MGTGVSRIEQEFILTAVFEKHIPVQVHGSRQEASGMIANISPNDVVIELDVPVKTGREERLRVFFSYFGHVMTFTARVRNVVEKTLTVAYPKSIYKNLQRKYERVPAPAGTKLYFILKNTKFELNFPKSEDYNPADKPETSEKFRPESMSDLIATFRQSLLTKCSENRITMLRDRAPVGFEEEIIARTGKMLYIPLVDEELEVLEGRIGERLIPRSQLTRARGEGADQGGRSFASLLQEKRANGIAAELYCPVLFHEYFVGYVYLVSRERGKGIDVETLEYVYQFSLVLAYSLKLNNYFKGAEAASERYDAEIVNLSASGLLFANDSAKLKESSVIYADMPIILQAGDRRMTISSRLMRKFEDAKACYFGLQFLEVKPEDFRFLFDFVYGRNFSKEDAELWEGGTAPPPLEL